MKSLKESLTNQFSANKIYFVILENKKALKHTDRVDECLVTDNISEIEEVLHDREWFSEKIIKEFINKVKKLNINEGIQHKDKSNWICYVSCFEY